MSSNQSPLPVGSYDSKWGWTEGPLTYAQHVKREAAIAAAAKIYAHWLYSEEGQAARAKRRGEEQ